MRKKFLLIESDPKVVAMIIGRLKESGYAAVYAYDGEAGLEIKDKLNYNMTVNLE